MNFSYIWPVALVVLSSVGYQVGLKEVAHGGEPMAALMLTYLAAGAASFVIYFFQAPKGENLLKGIFSVNISAMGLGLTIVGIEVGSMFMFIAGWPVNTAFLVANSLIVLALMIVGAILYGEKLKPRQIAGVVVSMVGIGCMMW